MRIEATGQTILNATIGLTRDEALTLLDNLSNWQQIAPFEGHWELVLRDGEHELTVTVTNHPSDPSFR
jgi:hypothetical protein